MIHTLDVLTMTLVYFLAWRAEPGLAEMFTRTSMQRTPPALSIYVQMYGVWCRCLIHIFCNIINFPNPLPILHFATYFQSIQHSIADNFDLDHSLQSKSCAHSFPFLFILQIITQCPLPSNQCIRHSQYLFLFQ